MSIGVHYVCYKDIAKSESSKPIEKHFFNWLENN